MNYLDLFAGIGGFHLGAKWAGWKFENCFFSEIEEYPTRVYKKNFPRSIELGDIKKIDGTKLKEQYKGDWIITGGFPCQDISSAGKRAGITPETRSGLWFEYKRLIGEIRPKFAIIENVSALLIRGLDIVLRDLAEMGYDAEWGIVRASDVGLPHRRERLWIIAYPDGKRYQSFLNESILHNKNTYKPQYSAQINTILTSDRDTIKRDCKYIREYHGIPSELDKSRIKALGNAIVPQIAEMLFKKIGNLTELENYRKNR